MASGERQSQLAALATVKRLLAKDSERTSFWRECFREADADNNSVLDKEEARVAVGEFIRRIYKCGDAWQPSDKKIDRIFVSCDVRARASITCRYFCLPVAATCTPPLFNPCAQANHDGDLSEQECGAFFLALLVAMRVHLTKLVADPPVDPAAAERARKKADREQAHEKDVARRAAEAEQEQARRAAEAEQAQARARAREVHAAFLAERATMPPKPPGTIRRVQDGFGEPCQGAGYQPFYRLTCSLCGNSWGGFGDGPGRPPGMRQCSKCGARSSTG